MRVAQNSLVEFPRLELLPSGAKASAINVLQGMVYVSLVNTKGNEFSVKFGQQTINLPPDSHIRLQLTPTEANLAVMHGDAQVQEPSGISTVGKNKTMTFNLAGQSQPGDCQERDRATPGRLGQECRAVPQELCQRDLVWELALLLRHQRHELLRKLRLRVRRFACGGRTLPAPAGIHTGAERGRTIRARAIPGFLLIPGAGHPTITAAGPSVRDSVGVGSQAAPGWDWQTTRSSLTLPLGPVDRPSALVRRAIRRSCCPIDPGAGKPEGHARFESDRS